jgi:hypothetical protein
MLTDVQKTLIEKLIVDFLELEVYTPLGEFYDRLFLSQPEDSDNILILKVLRAKAEISKMYVECNTVTLLGDIAGVDVSGYRTASTHLGDVLATIENLTETFRLYEQWEQ